MREDIIIKYGAPWKVIQDPGFPRLMVVQDRFSEDVESTAGKRVSADVDKLQLVAAAPALLNLLWRAADLLQDIQPGLSSPDQATANRFDAVLNESCDALKKLLGKIP